MYIKFILVALVIFAVVQDANGKKSKKKRINNDASESTPQPNVLTYSTFGFNDVGSYNGFVPSSPDYANYLTKSQETSTRLYAPAFPSALDTTSLGSYYDPQPETGSFTLNSGMNGNDNLNQGVSINFFTSPNHDLNNNEGKEVNSRNVDDINLLKYGTKLNSKSKNKHFNNNNSTEYNIFGSVSSAINGDAAVYNKNAYSNYPSLPSAPTSIENDKFVTMPSHSNPSSLKFSKFVDFSDVKNYYPTSVESQYQDSMHKPIVIEPIQNSEGNVNFHSFQDDTNNERKIEQSYKNKLNSERVKQDKEKNSFTNEDVSNSYTKQKNNYKTNRFKNDFKEKVKDKTKAWNTNYNNENNGVRNPLKGYEYATNYSATSFKFDYEEPKNPFNSSIDEISPASSNLDFVNYQSPEKEFSNFQNIQNINSFDFDNQGTFPGNYRDKYLKPTETLSSFKNLYSSIPSTTSHWGNIFKNSEYSSHKKYPSKPYLDDESTDDFVHIPKRPQKSKYVRYTDIKLDDLSFSNGYKPYKLNDNKQEYDWPKDFFNTRFKSEEDLLGLRNHDTSHPYHSSLKPSYNDFAEEIDYKKLTQKWKQNYLRSKYRDANREYESYASESKPIHVPLPKPYPIEVPHPVIVPVPQPYPVKVPIPKPVAVPVIRELKVPVEKPMPYPVIKKVPYPIEKLVPVPVEKQVHVPVIKPYPVHIPQIRPVFHHTKPHDDQDSNFDEDEYIPRPDTKRPVYKRPKNSSNNRPHPSSRRPSRMTYQDRNRKRVPSKRPGYNQRPRRPYHSDQRPQKYRDFEEYDSDSEFDNYCKRSGRC